MSVERQRSRTVTALVLSSLAQDTCLLVANTASGAAGFLQGVGTSFSNFAQTFAWLFNDQQQKYEALSGRKFASSSLASRNEEEEELGVDDD